MMTETQPVVFAVGDRVAHQPPYGAGMVGTVRRVSRAPFTGRQACRVEWDGASPSWELAGDLVSASH